MNFLDKMISLETAKFYNEKEQVIIKAICHKTGRSNFKIDEIKNRCVLKQYPNQTEIFVFDDEELILFEKMEHKTIINKKRNCLEICLSQKYKLLYEQGV